MTTTCPSDAELRELLLGRGPDTVGDHLLDCPKCGAKAGQLVASDPLLSDLRAANDTSELGSDGTFVEELLKRVRKAPAKPVDKELDFLDPPSKEHPDDLGRFNHYRIVQKIGQGGMGMVFKAVDTTLDRTVALKIILPRYAENTKLRDRFIEEAKATVKVRSPHVAEIYEINVWRNVPYLTMELLVGTTLDKRPKPMALDALRRIGFSIAKGLSDAHRSGLIHRDLKPSNIHLGTDARTGKPTVKLIDFGLARPVNRDIEITKSGELLGTPAYMSPEQARGKKVDHRTDLYSLGVILHQLATGKLPYDSANEGVMAILTELATPEPLTSVARRTEKLPPSLAKLIDRLLSKDAANRPASADEVMKILKESLNEKVDPNASSTGTAIAESAPYVSISDSTGPYEQSMAFSEMKTEPDDRPVAKPARRWAWPAVGVGVVVAALVVAILAGAFNVKVKTKDGPVIELADLPDDAEVTVDGEVVKVSWNEGKTKAEVRVKPGTRTIEVKKDGFRVTGEEITLAEGERKPFTVRLEKLELGEKPAAELVAAVPSVVTSAELVVNGNADDRLKGWESKDGNWNVMGPEVRDPFFRPGRCKSAVLQQDVDVANLAVDIDAGLVEFKFSGLISCYSKGQKDKASLRLVFLDTDKKELGTGYDTGFVHESVWKEYGGTPKPKVGTRYVRIILHSRRDNTPGNYENSGYYDNISLKALTTKLPATFAKLRPAVNGSTVQFFGTGFLPQADFVTGPEAYANVLMMGVSTDSQTFIDAARRASRTVVLLFQGKSREGIESSLYPILEKNRDTVAGVFWSLPYANGYDPAAVASFGRDLKQKFPGLTYLVSFVEKPNGKHETKPVPEEVDVVVVTNYFDKTPANVQAKTDDCLPVWAAKAGGRPIYLLWTNWDNNATGIVPSTQPGTFRACLEAAKKHRIAGILFHALYSGTTQGMKSIDANPPLYQELVEVGRAIGFANLPASPNASDVAKLPAVTPGTALPFFGVGFKSRADSLARFAPASNFLFASGLPDAQPFIDAARTAKRPLVLTFGAKSRAEVEAKLFPVVEKNRDVVAGICWSLPYGNGYQPADVAALGTAIKKQFPGLTYGVSFADRPADPLTPSTIPPEVDLVVVNLYGDNTPDKVRAKTDLVLPDWIARANGRPMILRWAAWEVDMGLVPRTDVGTFRACVDAAKKFKIAGVAFEPIDDDPRGFKGIDSNPALAKEIEDLGRTLGIAMPSPSGTPNDRNRFNVRKGQWSIIGDELAQTDAVEHYGLLEFGDENWTDYDYSVDVKRVSGNDQAALLYRWTSPSNFNLFGIGTSGNSFVVVEWQKDGQIGYLNNFNYRLNNNQWYTMIVKVRGNRMTSELRHGADKVRSWVADSDRHPKGKVGLRTVFSHMRFKNIKVTAPDGTVLWDGLPNIGGAPATAQADYTNSLGMKFVRVPKGRSWLSGASYRDGDREVNFPDDYYLGQFEVTQAEWRKVMGKNPSHFSKTGEGKDAVKNLDDATIARLPVEMVSWNDCQEFLTKLNEQAKETGWTYRLPTWEEWEYACRGGPMKVLAESRSNFYLAGPINSLTALQANYRITGLARTAPVGSYPPNKLGLYDMHGNVWEYLHDAVAPDLCKGFGNSWNNETHELRNAWGSPIPRSSVGSNMGLRVVRVPATPKPASTRTVDLLALVDVSRDAVKGTWTRGPDGISSDNSAFCRIKIPYKPLPAEYDYRVEFTAKGAGNDVLQLLSAGGTSFSFLMGAWGGKWDGFDAVTGHPLTRAGTNIIGGPTSIKARTRHTVVISVRKDSISATIDGKLVAKHATNYADLRMPDEWKIGDGLLGLGTTIDPTTFHKAELVEVTPAAVPVPMAVPAPTPAPKAAGNFAPLFNGKDLTGWEAVGNASATWKVENGELVGGWKNSDFVGGSTLETKRKDYRHFRLRVTAKPTENWPSRIFCLSPFQPTAREYFKVWIGTEKEEANRETGRLTLRANDAAPLLAKAKVAADAWNTIEIEVKGNRVQVFVDGVKTADQTDDRMPAAGNAIGLHLTGGSVLRVKGVEIEELKP
ncbi:MAG: SUMF1/EgtB/PvdO family nonheme iron enzyme [Gemmataceae bacterium]|nr:SUMF1/EgtB/PvdO family nonheme iron enzyme [Gemmataceae bacterium]